MPTGTVRSAKSAARCPGGARSRYCAQVIHRTRGGGPRRSRRSTTVGVLGHDDRLCRARAARKISRSFVSRRPRLSHSSRLDTADARRSRIRGSGDSCASIQIVTSRRSDGQCDGSRNASMPGCPPAPGQGARAAPGRTPSRSRGDRSTSVTRMRIPRMQGRPPHCSGSTVIRSASFATSDVLPSRLCPDSRARSCPRPMKPELPSM